MLRIQIDIPRPFQTLVLTIALGALVWVGSSISSANDGPSPQDASGGRVPEETIHEAEQEIDQTRLEQELLRHREEILRYQIRMLEEAHRLRTVRKDPEAEARYEEVLEELIALMKEKQQSETLLLESFRELWEAQGKAVALGRSLPRADVIRLAWPVEPLYGISAGFEDPDYQTRFGIAHQAVDIPALQGTEVLAAADGVVEEVRDNGLGFNSLTIRHDGFVTLYGHVESFLVQEGEQVRAGDRIALSGGMPGTPGAGHLTTGPHLHLELISGGEHLDPLQYLPKE
jgi:murein DD-endopeptidase MepM/ murein hydrolase activator NlpD